MEVNTEICVLWQPKTVCRPHQALFSNELTYVCIPSEQIQQKFNIQKTAVLIKDLSERSQVPVFT